MHCQRWTNPWLQSWRERKPNKTETEHLYVLAGQLQPCRTQATSIPKVDVKSGLFCTTQLGCRMHKMISAHSEVLACYVGNLRCSKPWLRPGSGPGSCGREDGPGKARAAVLATNKRDHLPKKRTV